MQSFLGTQHLTISQLGFKLSLWGFASKWRQLKKFSLNLDLDRNLNLFKGRVKVELKRKIEIEIKIEIENWVLS